MIENPHYDGSPSDKGPKGDTGPQGPKGDPGTFTTPTADVSFGNHRITNLGGAIDGDDALNRDYADTRYFKRGANVDMTTAKITNLGDATDAGDALNKNYADNRYLHFNPNVDMRGRSITNMDTPTNPADAATKDYVDRHNPISRRTYAMKRTINRTKITFAHNFPRGEIYFIWFTLLYIGNQPMIVFHPYGPGFRQEIIGHVDRQDYIIYEYDSTNISFRRGGNHSPTLTEIGIIYVPNI